MVGTWTVMRSSKSDALFNPIPAAPKPVYTIPSGYLLQLLYVMPQTVTINMVSAAMLHCYTYSDRMPRKA